MSAATSAETATAAVAADTAAPASEPAPSAAPAPPATEPSPPPAVSVPPARNERDRQLRLFAKNYFGLDETQCAQVAALMDAQSLPASPPARAGDGPGAQAASTIDIGRQHIQNVIRQSLGRTQTAVMGNAKAERAAETAVLGAVERATSLQDLRPTRPAGGAQAPAEDPLIAHIAARLTELIKLEVDACFQQQIGPLASQLRDVIQAAQSNGLLPETSDAASSDESRGTTENSGKSAETPDRDNNNDNASKAPGSASQRV